MAVLSKPFINRLPVETLTEIWALLKPFPGSLGRILKVCRHWNGAKDIPSLWGTLSITERTDQELLETWIHRSKNAGLSVTINFRRAAYSAWMNLPEEEYNTKAHFIKIMDALVSVSHHWCRLEIVGPSYLEPLMKHHFSSSLAVPRLTHLVFNLEQGPTDHAHISNCLFQPSLSTKNLEIFGYSLQWETFPFQTVTTLALGRAVEGNPLGWNTFVQALGDAPNLQSLAFFGGLPFTGPPYNAGALLQQLTLPALTSLSLTQLTTDELHHVLEKLYVPQLISLALSLTDTDSSFLPFLEAFPACFPRVATLVLEGIHVDKAEYPALLPFFTRLSGVTTLRLNFHGIPAQFWQALVAHAAEPSLMPLLNEVHLVDAPFHSVQEFVELRKTAQKLIPHISLHYSGWYPKMWNSTAPSTKWLEDNVKHLFITNGKRHPWVPGPMNER
ncbi:hypothetical protein DFH06DRAFT_1325228 [Mycena polygramma]|nr:hypothetical protein DFH06DRAFT_1325228 [Mycena polygramma]